MHDYVAVDALNGDATVFVRISASRVTPKGLSIAEINIARAEAIKTVKELVKASNESTLDTEKHVSDY